MLERLVKPLITSGVDAVAKRGEQTIAHETGAVVAKDVAKKVVTQDVKIVSKEAASKLAARDAAKIAGKDVAKAAETELPELVIKKPVKLLHADKFPMEAPRLSPKGDVVAFGTAQEHWLPEWFRKLIGLPADQKPETLRVFVKAADGSGEPQKVAGRTFKNAVQPTFTRDGEALIFAEQKHLPIGSGERLQEMRLRKANLKTGAVETIYNGHPTLIHPQVSPDGKHIVAYSRTPGHEGIYLLDAADPKKAPFRLTNMDDKHPIFTADGKKIVFHNQTGGKLLPGQEEGEKAFIGVLDLTDPKAPKRKMLDAIGSETYHKHPTVIPNTDLVIYHAKDNGAKPHLEIVDSATGQRAKIKLEGTSPSGAPLKDWKHPSVSDDGKQLLILGRPKKPETGPREDYMLYTLEGVDQIVSAFKAAFGK